MKKRVLTIETRRSCYGLEQLGQTMTVGELIAELRQYDEDMPVAFSNDHGYTYGEIYGDELEVEESEEEEEE